MVCIRSVRSERPLVITTRSIRELPINPPQKKKKYIINRDRSLRLLRTFVARSAPLQLQGDVETRSLLSLVYDSLPPGIYLDKHIGSLTIALFNIGNPNRILPLTISRGCYSFLLEFCSLQDLGNTLHSPF